MYAEYAAIFFPVGWLLSCRGRARTISPRVRGLLGQREDARGPESIFYMLWMGGGVALERNFFLLVGPILTQKIGTDQFFWFVFRTHMNLHDKAKVLCKH